MGMDVMGKQPKNEAGKYFRNNCWWWRPLAAYVQHIAPEITSACKYWQSNDGDGLDAEGAEKLAKEIFTSIEDGRAAAYISIYQAEIAALPNEGCDLCGSTGVRDDAVGRDLGMPTRRIMEEGHPRQGETGWCNACDGKGWKPPSAASYPISLENIKDFAGFLESCGGFQIF